MTARCHGCGYTTASDTHRGARLGTCPECGGQLRGWTAGQARGRYRCPVTGHVFTFGLRHSFQLTEPMRLAFIAGWDDDRREPDPDRPGWLRPVLYHRTEPGRYGEQDTLDRTAGMVFGPGCVLSRDYRPPAVGDFWAGRAGVYLVPAPNADPATWFVNERLVYKRCRGCGAMVIANEDGRNRMDHEWVPQRTRYTGNGWTGTRPVNMGPHPAGSYGCRQCREGDLRRMQ